MINEFQNENRFLSNFWPCLFVIDNISYNSVEHYYQSMKAEKPEDAKLIREASVGESKRLGRRIKIREDWNEIKDKIMAKGIYAKFTQHKDLKQKLIETFPEDLIEGNRWHDNYWGDCYCHKCANIEGTNKLGYLLKLLRINIKSGL